MVGLHELYGTGDKGKLPPQSVGGPANQFGGPGDRRTQSYGSHETAELPTSDAGREIAELPNQGSSVFCC